MSATKVQVSYFMQGEPRNYLIKVLEQEKPLKKIKKHSSLSSSQAWNSSG